MVEGVIGRGSEDGSARRVAVDYDGLDTPRTLAAFVLPGVAAMRKRARSGHEKWQLLKALHERSH